jgi:TrmH family RNA methyltransferase
MDVAARAGRQHPFVKRCRSLLAGRDGEGVVLLDGDHVIGEALAAGVPLDGLLTDDRTDDLVRAAAQAGIPIHRAPRAIVDGASPVQSPTGVVAIARWKPQTVDGILDRWPRLVLGLVGVQDPGNVGGIIRSAHALGGAAVLALDATADPAGWKALRGAAGSTFRIDVGRGALADLLASAAARRIPVAATIPAGGTRLDAIAWPSPAIVLVGSEGAGLPAEALAAAALRVTIPMTAGANSLNVGVAAALVLWEAARHRP